MTGSNQERRKPKWYQVLLQGLVPALILAIVTWIAATVADTKVQIAEHRVATAGNFAMINVEIREIRNDLIEHNKDSKNAAVRNSLDHHRGAMTPCNRCHSKQ